MGPHRTYDPWSARARHYVEVKHRPLSLPAPEPEPPPAPESSCWVLVLGTA